MQPPSVNHESHVDVKPRNAAVLTLFTLNSRSSKKWIVRAFGLLLVIISTKKKLKHIGRWLSLLVVVRAAHLALLGHFTGLMVRGHSAIRH